MSGEVSPSAMRWVRLGMEPSWKQMRGYIQQHWDKLTDDDLDNIERSWEAAFTRAGVDPSTPIRSLADWRKADPNWRDVRLATAEFLSLLATRTKVSDREQDKDKVVVSSTGSSPQRQGRSTSTPHTKAKE